MLRAWNRPAWPSLFIDQNILKICDSVKVLGVTIQSDLKWDGQVDHMLSLANSKLFALRRLKKFGVRDHLYRLCVPCVRVCSSSLAQFRFNWSN